VILTPVELHDGIWLKREDRHTGPYGVNGAKLRACQHLIGRAAQRGATRVISAASVLSPQNAMAAVVAAENGLPCTVIIGGSKPETATTHPSIRIASELRADIVHVPVGYNPYLQSFAAKYVDRLPGTYWLRYGITTPPDASVSALADFHNTGATQVANLPDSIKTLVVPFGSGNSATSVLFGLATQRCPTALERVILMGIGPDRLPWLHERLATLGVRPPVPVERIDLHGTGFARYGDKMPATFGGVVMHPTYEGKVVRWLNQHEPDWWTVRDATTCLWIVGGPLPKPAKGARRA
jgi:Pyridoxal-phosphate dependent enzyme